MRKGYYRSRKELFWIIEKDIIRKRSKGYCQKGRKGLSEKEKRCIIGKIQKPRTISMGFPKIRNKDRNSK